MTNRAAIWRVVLRGAGLVLLAVGLAALYIGPIELDVYRAFSEGGRFHYPGFGYGSLMFAYIAVQVAAYYLIGALGLVLGYGHLALRRWAHALTTSLLWAWLAVGLPLTALAVLMWVTSKGATPTGLLLAIPFLILVYPVAPALLLRLYRGEALRGAFTGEPSPLEETPLPVRGTCVLLLLVLLALHGPMLLNGVAPVYGELVTGRQGVLILDGLVILLGWLIWGYARGRRWAWWGAVAYFGGLTASAAVTFARASLRDVLAAMALPARELEWFQGVPFLDAPLAVAVAIPLGLMTLLVLVVGGIARRR